MRRFHAILTIVCLCLPTAGFSFSISMAGNNVVKWNTADLTYYIDPNGAPDITDGSDVQQMRQGFQGWQAVTCSALTFTELGTTNNKNVIPITGQTNGRNELVFITDSRWTFGSYVLGVTSPVYYYDGVIREADIAFNGYNMSWSTTPNPYKAHVLSVAIHEEGHFFGLQHVLYGYDPNDPPTMAPVADPWGKTQDLTHDDELGACFLYPQSGYYTCSSNSECPYVVDVDSQGNEYYSKKINCQNGYCTGIAGVSPGSVDFGGTCTKNTDCKSPYTCATLDSGVMMCTNTCDPYNDTCPQNYHCALVSASNKNLCIPGAKKKGEGEACSTSYECASGFCFPAPDGSGSTCRIACNKNDPQCPAGQACWAPTYGTVGGCYPESQVPIQPKPVGSKCTKDAECLSGICYSPAGQEKLCRLQCTVDLQNCPDNYYCADIGGRGACIPGEKPVVLKADGDACTANEECKSGWCVLLIGTNESYCRSACNLKDMACAWGTSCVSYGSDQYGVCMPSIGKSGTGAVCSAPSDCVSNICYTDSQGRKYCTQNCINGSCPNGMECVNGGYFGMLCSLPQDKPPEKKPDDTPCTTNEECKSNWCVPLIGTNQGFCRTACSLDNWACAWGTSCVSYGSDKFGVCMPSIDKTQTGYPCSQPLDCVTAICWNDPQGNYCTQNCIKGWCPPGLECKNGGYYGDVCLKPSSQSIEPSEDIYEVSPPEDIAQTGSSSGKGGSGGGCSSAASMSPKAHLTLVLLPFTVFVLLAGKRRREG